MLKGYRTYLSAAVLFLLGGSLALGWISTETAEYLAIMLTGTGLAALRAAK